MDSNSLLITISLREYTLAQVVSPSNVSQLVNKTRLNDLELGGRPKLFKLICLLSCLPIATFLAQNAALRSLALPLVQSFCLEPQRLGK